MKADELRKMGLTDNKARKLAFEVIKKQFREERSVAAVSAGVADVIADPVAFLSDPDWAELAEYLTNVQQFTPRATPAPWKQWGADLDENAIEQMRNACDLPVAVSGALMPDAHLGYGLPIGGVLATENAVIPYAVGVDIACRMKMTVLDIPLSELEDDRGRTRLTRAIENETRFGTGVVFQKGKRREHAVLDMDWSVSKVTEELKSKAWAQLGTSGSGNHFVEFGEIFIESPDLGIEPGHYVALLSHSGSRGTGAAVAGRYSKLAMDAHPELPDRLKHLAWLGMDSELGQEYWAAMNLMGEYAAGNHACIHKHVAKNLGAEVLLDVENHHNFAWKEVHDGREVYVHRKGATPAGAGVLGIIPGSMASSAYLVRGKGNAASLYSASHGAGRVMSRKKAKENLDWKAANQMLKDRKVTLLSAGIDEVPMVYKDIEEVMNSQADLVDKLARFQPRIVKMAPAGERPED